MADDTQPNPATVTVDVEALPDGSRIYRDSKSGEFEFLMNKNNPLTSYEINIKAVTESNTFSFNYKPSYTSEWSYVALSIDAETKISRSSSGAVLWDRALIACADTAVVNHRNMVHKLPPLPVVREEAESSIRYVLQEFNKKHPELLARVIDDKLQLRSAEITMGTKDGDLVTLAKQLTTPVTHIPCPAEIPLWAIPVPNAVPFVPVPPGKGR